MQQQPDTLQRSGSLLPQLSLEVVPEQEQSTNTSKDQSKPNSSEQASDSYKLERLPSMHANFLDMLRPNLIDEVEEAQRRAILNQRTLLLRSLGVIDLVHKYTLL